MTSKLKLMSNCKVETGVSCNYVIFIWGSKGQVSEEVWEPELGLRLILLIETCEVHHGELFPLSSVLLSAVTYMRN